MDNFAETKIYSDGSHYIGIPHTTRKLKYRPKKPEEVITIKEDNEEENQASKEDEFDTEEFVAEIPYEEIETDFLPFDEDEKPEEKKKSKGRQTTKKQLFDELYQKYYGLKKKERFDKIYNEMLPYFENAKRCEDFVNANFERRLRNIICRKVRMTRKANLANFNYFVTFTYDNEKHTEESFRKGIKTTLRNFCFRKHWKYMGVWERAPETNRLHFHALVNIPDGTLPGEIITKKDFDTRAFKMRITKQSSYFNERFGRSDFEEINEFENPLGNSIAYLMKYIEKTGEKIVYSKNLPQYFISDILEDDVICRTGLEDKKIVLFDDFRCIDNGEYLGTVSPEVIQKLRKAN